MEFSVFDTSDSISAARSISVTFKPNVIRQRQRVWSGRRLGATNISSGLRQRRTLRSCWSIRMWPRTSGMEGSSPSWS